MLKEVRDLQRKKARLIGVCEAQREMFARDWRQIEAKLHWVETASSFLVRFRPGLLVAAPLAGILVSLLARKQVRLAGIVEQISMVWKALSRFKALFRGVSAARQLVAKDWPEI